MTAIDDNDGYRLITLDRIYGNRTVSLSNEDHALSTRVLMSSTARLPFLVVCDLLVFLLSSLCVSVCFSV